uniref:AMP-dependent synthetase/ligase domain-containing protein n=1 Tax=Glossina brevipalpis TaxID=37001 RepID=A0A1A9WF31_9MUSC
MRLFNIKNFYMHFGQSLHKRLYTSKNAPSPEYLTKLRECYRLEEDNNIVVPVFKKALLYGNNIAIRDHAGEYSYFQLYSNSKRLSRQIANLCGSGSSSTVAFFYSNDVLSTLTLWACWMCGQVAMPLRLDFPCSDLVNLLKSSKTRLLIAPEKYGNLSRKLAYQLDVPTLCLDHMFIKKHSLPFNYSREIFMNANLVILEGTLTNDFYTTFDALLLNTLGKVNKLKTAVLSHKNLSVQIKSAANAWQVSAEDRVFQIFTSDHINGYINATLFPLSAGSTVQMHEPFDANNCWSTILGINTPQKDRVNILITEPKVYNTLIIEYEKIFLKNSRMVEFIKNYCMRNFRLMISSFSPLPLHIAKRWFEITGHNIIESFYITESGITLRYNPQHDQTNTENQHKVTLAFNNTLPDIKVRIVDNCNKIVYDSQDLKRYVVDTRTIVGNLLVGGPGIFRKYLNIEKRSDEKETYFNTGDIVTYEDGLFKILGRCKIENFNTLATTMNDIEEFYSRLNLHPSINFDKLENKGVVYAIKPNQRMSLKSLKLFYAIILKEYYRAIVFQLNMNK